tara:strand:- start:41 stop:553 length:513 start_codon:yes stop_codon:yes gene_type:complete
MKIDLKNIKTNNALSEETICFSANLYRDGKKIGTVANRGCGGSHEYGFDNNEYKLMDEWCKANLPKWESSFNNKLMDFDLEMHISEMVNDFNIVKWMSSLLRRKIVIIDDSCGYGESYQWKMPKSSTLDAWIRQILEGKWASEHLNNPIVLNKLDTRKAYDLMHQEENKQ